MKYKVYIKEVIKRYILRKKIKGIVGVKVFTPGKKESF
jgi:hypothetical protein